MTMNKRCSLFVTGCLMAVLVLFGSTEALADYTYGFVKDKDTVAEGGTVNITLNVDAADTGGGEPTAAIMVVGDGLVFYGREVTMNGAHVVVTPAMNQTRATITAASVADSDGMNEEVTLTITKADARTAGDKYEIKVTVIDGQRASVEFKADEATVLEGAKTSVSLTAAGIERTHNAAATVHVEEMSMDGVRRVQLLKEGASYDGDGRLILTFGEDMDVDDELKFDVQGLPDADGMNAETKLMLMMPGNGVMLGSMTEMMVMVIDDDDDDGTTPTPTPALPIFGAFALGAGLLAVGRARLRRREQRQLTR